VSDLAGRHPDAVPELPAVEPLRLEAAHFVNALSTGAPFRSDIVDGARVVEILEAGQESLAQGGRPVSLEPTRTGSKTAYPSRVTSR
jgi:predicted dehydrogenase